MTRTKTPSFAARSQAPGGGNHFDQSELDVYTGNLAATGDKLGCTAVEDIYSEFGMLLIAKGTPISPKTAERLSGHRLRDPLDKVAQLAARLSSGSLVKAFNQRIERVDLLGQACEALELHQLIRHLCLAKELPSGAMQKLSVMAYGFPDLFARTLGGCVLAIAIGKTLNWPAGDLQNLFYASLFRDLSLLHLAAIGEPSPPQFSDRTLWHSHKSAALLKQDRFFDPAVIKLVRDHHERPDGTGYPTGSFGNQVSHQAWCISFCDQLWGLASRQHSYRMITPFLMVNSIGRGGEIANALMRIFMKCGLGRDEVRITGDRAELSRKLMERNLEINQIYALLVILLEILAPRQDTDLERTMAAIVQSNVSLIQSSGMGESEIIEMLVGDNNEFQASDSELLEFDLIQVEFLWRVKRFLLLATNWLQAQPEQDLNLTELIGSIKEIWQGCHKNSFQEA